MSLPAVHQLVPSVVPGDATTGHTLQFRRLLRDLGHDSDIYALTVHPELEDDVHLIHELAGPTRRDRFFIYQLSTHSSLADWLIGRREPLAVNYHNVTPGSFFRRWDRSAMLALRSARVQVAQLGRIAMVGVCDSSYNAADLEGEGWTATTVVPVLVDYADFDAEPDPQTVEALLRRRGAGARWLFVGALAPHKAQHRLIAALAA